MQHFQLEEYSVEEVTPERMAKVDADMREAVLMNRQFNGNNLVNTYQCRECRTLVFTADTHVGVTPFSMGCTNPSCDGTMESSGYKPKIVRDQHTGPVHFEWYRPTTEEECAAYRAWCWEVVNGRDLSKVGEYTDEEKEEIRRVMADDIAGHVLRGGLDRREVKA